MRKVFLSLLVLLVLSSVSVQAGLFFWDANGSAPGAGSSTPTGTWGVDAYWNEDATGGGGQDGTNGPVAWTSGAAAVFAAGDDATDSYTVTVTSNLKVADIHVDLGNVTFVGGPINLNTWDNNNTNRLLSVGHKDHNAVARYNTVLTGAFGITRYKRGTLIFGATNTYTGPTTIEGGILQLGTSQAIPADSNLILSNNDNRPDIGPEFTPATLALDGFSQTLGTLTLTGPEAATPRTIDFGGGSAALAFANSSGESWTANDSADIPLWITNYTPGLDSLRFGVDDNGLTSVQLGLIRFVEFSNLPAQMDTQGFVTPALPRILSITKPDEDKTELTWTSVPDRNYLIQYKDDLGAASWEDVLPEVTALGETTSYADTPATSGTRYYRIVAVP